MKFKMKRRYKTKSRAREAGVALIIAIFALLLISVVAIALVVSSGTDSALQSNYRTSTGFLLRGSGGAGRGARPAFVEESGLHQQNEQLPDSDES